MTMKIFCIGLNKTGTISLHESLTTLGFRSHHWGGPATRIAVERAIREDVPLLTYLPEADTYSDIQRLSVSFDQLDVQYPSSRFILTTRPVDDWIDSRRRHVLRNLERRAAGAIRRELPGDRTGALARPVPRTPRTRRALLRRS